MEPIVDLELLDHRRGPTDDRWWTPPFDWDVVYEYPHWWKRQLEDDPWFVQVLEGGAEVARIEFDDPGGVNPNYANVPPLGGERLEIQLIEVAGAARGRRLGTQVVRALAERYPNRRLFAYSEGADRFWASIAWEPFYDPATGPRRPHALHPATAISDCSMLGTVRWACVGGGFDNANRSRSVKFGRLFGGVACA